MASYLDQIRTLPVADAAMMLDALFDKMWARGAQDALHARDDKAAACFERHVSERSSEAHTTLAAIARAAHNDLRGAA